MDNLVSFVPHCDDPPCGLGAVWYTCPKCKKNCTDYEVWYKEEELYAGEVVKLNCEECSTPLLMKYDKEEYSVIVEIDEQQSGSTQVGEAEGTNPNP